MWTKDERGFYFADGDIVLSVMNSGRWFFDFRNCPVSAGVAGDAESGKIAVKKSFTEWARNKIKTVKGIE